MSNILYPLSWYLLISLVGIISFPIVFRFLPKLPSKGYGLAKPLGLLLWGYGFWLLGSLGILQNNIGGIVAIGSLIIGISFLALKSRTAEIFAWFKQNWKTVLTMEVLFLTFFVIWVIVRAANPDVSYTEKPMELAFINSLLKSPNFPPQDPWLSGYSISYYYFGYVLISILIRVTTVPAAVGFNLSSALWFALTALAAYGILFDLLSEWNKKRIRKRETGDSLPRAGGLLAPFFILIVSNLEGLLEFLHARGIFWKLDSSGNLVSKFWTWLAISELDQAPLTPFSWLPSRTSGWLWWRGSRILTDLNLANGKIEIIDEFPFFSFLLSDLHPHLLALPFGLLSLGVCLNFYLTISENSQLIFTVRGWIKKWEFWLACLIFGSLAFINTWDFPIYVGMFALVFTYHRIATVGMNWKRVLEFLGFGLTIGITGVLLFIPFYIGFKSQAGGLLPSLEYMTRGVHFWIMFGVFLLPIFIWLIYLWRNKQFHFRYQEGILACLIIFGGAGLLSLAYSELLFALNNLGTNVSNLLPGVGAKLQYAGQAFTGLHGGDVVTTLKASILRRIASPGTWLTLNGLFILTWGILASRKRQESPDEIENELLETKPKVLVELKESTTEIRYFVLLLVLVGIALTLFPESFYLRDQFGTRMNTIFKFYYQAWVFWGIAAAFASVELLSQLRKIKGFLFNILWVLLILGGIAYPVIMTWDKTSHFKPATWSLDGNAYLIRFTPDEMAAITWLSQAPVGIVAEAVGGSYTDYARVSTRTGFPTVLGWPGHESQWRGGFAEIGSRQADIETLYKTNSWEEANAIIRKYNIKYIYVGNLEKAQYQVSGDKFLANLPLIYSNSSVSIYEAPSLTGVLIK